MPAEFEFIKTASRAEEVCRKLMEAKTIGVDTETTGLDPHKDVVTLLSLSTKTHGTYVADTRDKRILEPFRALFESESIVKIEHNGIFDYQMIKGTIGAETENIWCTQLGEYALTAGLQFDGYGLEAVTSKYLGIARDKSLQKSFIGHTGAFTQAQLQYAADDTAYLLDIAEIMKQKAVEKGVLKAWRIETQALQSFGDMEFYGQLVDRDGWTKVMRQNVVLAKAAKRDLDKFFAPVCNRRFCMDPDSDDEYEVDMNYDSTPSVLSKLRQLGVEIDGNLIGDTSKKTQQKIQTHPIIMALSKYRAAMKGHSGFGDQYIKAIHPITGRVHFRFNQYGAATGRPTCRGGLNCLNIPREQRYRDCFTTDIDRLLSTADYSGAELRIIADQSGDPLMVKGFNSGMDFHCFVAALIFNKEKVEKKDPLRTPTKKINFGLAYGSGPQTLLEQINGEGYPMTLDECKKMYWKYMDTFKVTISWLKAQQREASTNFQMQNINGRMRHWIAPDQEKIEEKIKAELEKAGTLESYSDLQISELVRQKKKSQLAAIEREGANFKIQSVNADFSKVAMHRCRKEFKKMGWGPNTAKGARTYNMVYDEIVYDFHKDFTEGHEIQKKIMLESANEMLKRVPMEVEGHVDRKWVK